MQSQSAVLQNPFSETTSNSREDELLAGAQMQRMPPRRSCSLPDFRADARFSTWLYRIAVDHLLSVRKHKWAASDAICSFSLASAGLRQVPDLDPPDPRTIPVPVEILVEGTGNNCMIGTLLFLDGRQRVVFILGEIFQVSDKVGADIVEIAPENFRQILSRARRDLGEYLRDNCSLINPANDCKCARKTRSFIQVGFVNPEKLEFTQDHVRRVQEVVAQRLPEKLASFMEVAARVYRGHPFYEPWGAARDAPGSFVF